MLAQWLQPPCRQAEGKEDSGSLHASAAFDHPEHRACHSPYPDLLLPICDFPGYAPLRVSIIVLRAIVPIVVVAAATTMRAMTAVIARHTEGYRESFFSLGPNPTD